MLTCGSCTDKDCPDAGTGHSACDVFTQDDTEEEPTPWQPTLDDYNELKARTEDILEDLGRANASIARFESAIAGLVRWAQGEDNPA